MSKCGLTLVLGLALALLATPLAGTADAAPFKRKGEVSLKSTFEPNEALPGDIVLPMPGEGLSMVFRLVAVPVKGATDSLNASFGLVNTADDRAFYDSSRHVPISAPFEARDLPASWLEAIAPDRRNAYRYYLIAKYEVSRGQYQAVMGSVPDVSGQKPDANRPVTNVSWYDAIAFTGRYTSWLLAHHPDSLPRFADAADAIGYLRLPTEAEWEYAALGGQAAAKPGSQMAFFVEGDNVHYESYAVYQGGDNPPDALAAIGTRQANPLGLYDTAGNAAEMTLDTFRFSLAGTLQGAAGGFMRKGGSFLAGQEEILPGCREEVSPFIREGVMRQSDLGFRPVISGMSLTKAARQEAARDVHTAMAASRAVDDSALIKDLTVLIRQSSDEHTRANLTALKAQLEENQRLAARAHMSTIESSLQNCLMFLKAVDHYEYRLSIGRKILKSRQTMLKRKPGEAATWKELVEKSERSVANFELCIDSVLNLYLTNIQKLIGDCSQQDITTGLKNLGKAYGKDSTRKIECALLGLMSGHLRTMYQGKRLRGPNVRAELSRLRTA